MSKTNNKIVKITIQATVGILLSWILGVYVFYRAYSLSLTHDEVGTSNLLFESVRNIMFHPNCFQSANNHILNSLLMKLSVSILGQSAWAMRLPNSLSFILFYVSAFFTLRTLIRTPWIFVLALIALTTNLYVLDFFSLCRGYGLALSFQMASVYFFIRYLQNNALKPLVISFLFAALAIYANFTWFNFYAALFACLALYQLYLWKWLSYSISNCIRPLVLPSIIFVAIYALSAIPMGYLKQMNEFRWGANGWFDFLFTFCGNLIYQTNTAWAITLEVLVLFSFVITTIAYFKCYGCLKKQKPYLFLILIILIIVLETIVQRNVLGIRYMDGRKAIMYVPLFTMLLFVFLEHLHLSFRKLAYVVSLILAILISFNLKSMNLRSVREWYYDMNSKKITYQLGRQLQEGKTIGAYWWYHPSISYYTRFELKQHADQVIRIEDSDTIFESDYLYLNPSKSPSTDYQHISTDEVGNSLWKRLQ